MFVLIISVIISKMYDNNPKLSGHASVLNTAALSLPRRGSFYVKKLFLDKLFQPNN